jgi:hypothetical protein
MERTRHESAMNFAMHRQRDRLTGNVTLGADARLARPCAHGVDKDSECWVRYAT